VKADLIRAAPPEDASSWLGASERGHPGWAGSPV